MKTQNIRLLEQSVLAGCQFKAIAPGLLQRALASPYQHLHPKCAPVVRDDPPNPSIAEDTQCLTVQTKPQSRLPVARLHLRHLLRNVASGGQEQAPGQFSRRIGIAPALAKRDDDAVAGTRAQGQMGGPPAPPPPLPWSLGAPPQGPRRGQ